jgi:hypothetical protein
MSRAVNKANKTHARPMSWIARAEMPDDKIRAVSDTISTSAIATKRRPPILEIFLRCILDVFQTVCDYRCA